MPVAWEELVRAARDAGLVWRRLASEAEAELRSCRAEYRWVGSHSGSFFGESVDSIAYELSFWHKRRRLYSYCYRADGSGFYSFLLFTDAGRYFCRAVLGERQVWYTCFRVYSGAECLKGRMDSCVSLGSR